MTEPHDDFFADVPRRTGLTEKGTRVLYHLDKASDQIGKDIGRPGVGAPSRSTTSVWQKSP